MTRHDTRAHDARVLSCHFVTLHFARLLTCILHRAFCTPCHLHRAFCTLAIVHFASCILHDRRSCILHDAPGQFTRLAVRPMVPRYKRAGYQLVSDSDQPTVQTRGASVKSRPFCTDVLMAFVSAARRRTTHDTYTHPKIAQRRPWRPLKRHAYRIRNATSAQCNGLGTMSTDRRAATSRRLRGQWHAWPRGPWHPYTTWPVARDAVRPMAVPATR